MKKIHAARLHYFRNGEHGEYMIVFRRLIEDFPAVQTPVAGLYGAFTDLLDREESLLSTMHKSGYTRQIVGIASRIDRILIGMHKTVAAALHHFDPATVRAAQILYDRFAAFGDISKKAYEEEALDVRLLVEDLLSDEYATKVAAVGLSPWVAELQDAGTAFRHLLALRNAESSQKPHERLKDVRHEMDIVYHRMTALITAAALLDGGAGTYDEFIALLNAEIAYFNNHTRGHARRDLGAGGACTVDPVAPQAATGRPVTPLPVARYREAGRPDVELLFARDYTVSYRNNVRPGMADLLLHGRGAYRGRKTVTFAIVAAADSG
ncbi:MAG: DUF6261 family protein [Tannerella sp.]|jgi:hypothetical protein|nr:DUF6261 family protein [Tannerella sp.]